MIPAPSIQGQGAGVVTADQLNTYLQGATNVAMLRAFAGLDSMTVWMQGTTTPNDGGQGTFFYDSDATAPDDNGVTTIQPTGLTGPGRWIRQPITPSSIAADTITYAQLVNASGAGVLGSLGAGPITLLTVSQLLTLIGASSTTPTGLIAEFGGEVAPTGWYICDGSAVSRTTDATLFGVISTTFGAGDGSTTFNLPDFRGRFPRGWDSSGSVDPGRTFGTTQASALQKHVHITPAQIAPGDAGQFGSSTVSVTLTGFTIAGTDSALLPLSNDGTTYSSYNPNPSGQVIATETRPTNVAVSFIIKR